MTTALSTTRKIESFNEMVDRVWKANPFKAFMDLGKGLVSFAVKGGCPVCGGDHTWHSGQKVIWCDEAGGRRIPAGGGEWLPTKVQPDGSAGLGVQYWWYCKNDEADTATPEENAAKLAQIAVDRLARDKAKAEKQARRIDALLTNQERDALYRAEWLPLKKFDRADLERRLSQLANPKAAIDKLEELKIVGSTGWSYGRLSHTITSIEDGLLIGGQIATGGKPKYIFSKVGGESCLKNGERPCAIFQPLWPEKVEAVVVVEGSGKTLYSQLLANAAGLGWVCLGGNGNAFSSDVNLKIAIESQPWNTPVFLFPDADWRTNKAVKTQVLKALESGIYDGCFFAKDGKAPDDLSLAQLRALVPLTTEDAIDLILGAPSIEYYNASDPEAVKKAFTPIAGKFKVNISGTGFGKSFQLASHIGSLPQGQKATIAYDGYRNMTDARLAALPEVSGRHNGLTLRNGKWVVATEGEEILKSGNCFRAKEIAALNEKGAFEAHTTSEAVCKLCPLAGKCRTGEGVSEDGKSYGYLKQMRENSKGSYRCHPALLPAVGSEQYYDQSRSLYFDEYSSLEARTFSEVKLDRAGIANAVIALKEEAPKWMPLFSLINQAGRYGIDPTEARKAIEGLTIEDCLKAAEMTANDLSGITHIEGIHLEDLDAATRRRFRPSDSAFAEIAQKAIPAFANSVMSVIQGDGAIAVIGDSIIFKVNTGFAQTILTRGAVLLDATPKIKQLEALFGADNLIYVSCAKPEKSKNLRIVKIHGLGKMTSNRSDAQQSMLRAATIELAASLTRHGKVLGVLENKRWMSNFSNIKNTILGTKLGDSVGTNRFFDAGCSEMLIVGAFNVNITAAQLEYQALIAGGLQQTFEDFYAQIQKDHMIQAIGRLRANRRNDNCTVYIADDSYEGADHEVSIEQLIKEAATGKAKTIARVAESISKLGADASHRAIARFAGVCAQTVNRLYAAAIRLLEFTGLDELIDSLHDAPDAEIEAIINEWVLSVSGEAEYESLEEEFEDYIYEFSEDE